MTATVSCPVLNHTDETCVWMQAGVLAFKLCDRGFDCEHCPLDAALRGDRASGGLAPSAHDRQAGSTSFPSDRLYSPGHTWLAPVAGRAGSYRFGVDGFAASVIGPPHRVHRCHQSGPARAGSVLCEVDLEEGWLPLTTPVGGPVREWNPSLEDDPGVLVAEPYGDGWIAELGPLTREALGGLLRAAEAGHQARLDARRFCRRAALQILMEADQAGPQPVDRVRAVTDLRHMLGGPQFIAILRDLIH